MPQLDRKTHIVQMASELLRERGFTSVSMKDVAEMVGITAPAIYRHFPGKQALLTAVISDGLGAAEAAVDDAGSAGLRDVIAGLASAAVDKRDLWLLLHRESRNLGEEPRRALYERFGRLTTRVADAIAAELPRSFDDAELLSIAALASLTAPSQYRLPMPRTTAVAALAASAGSVALSEVGNLRNTAGSVETHRSAPFNSALDRRESILSASATLFAERGYRSVTLDQIGRQVAIAGPSVYNHFPGKREILAGVLWRTVDWMEMDYARAMSDGTGPDLVLQRLFGGYADLALRHHDLLRVHINEVVHLSPEDRGRIIRAHDDFLERWTALLRKVRPSLSAGDARVRVASGLCVINELSQLPQFRGQPTHGPLLAGLATSALGV